jgi:hypothetical protein
MCTIPSSGQHHLKMPANSAENRPPIRQMPDSLRHLPTALRPDARTLKYVGVQHNNEMRNMTTVIGDRNTLHLNRFDNRGVLSSDVHPGKHESCPIRAKFRECIIVARSSAHVATWTPTSPRVVGQSTALHLLPASLAIRHCDGLTCGARSLTSHWVVSIPGHLADDRCDDGYGWSKTINSCVPVPTAAPAAPPGATFQCNDGGYSYSKTSQGVCSRHGGIAHAL